MQVLAQELPPIENFTSIDYSAGNQNWAISQSQEKLIYVANNEGLLEFNGANWTLYPSPNETIMRSVKVIGAKIYTGCYMEFGFWEKDSFGSLNYTSLSDELNIDLLEDEEFWNIFGIDGCIVFQSLNRIYIYDEKELSISTIGSEFGINKMFEVDGNIYFQKLNEGIFKIVNGKDTKFLDHASIKNKEVVNIFSFGNGLLLLTRNDGFFVFEDDILNRLETGDSFDLSNLGIYNAIQLTDKSFALGTISYGLVHLSQEGKLLHEINQSGGLINNTVLSIFEDLDNNIWTGLDNGISYININAPIKIFNGKKGVVGSVYTSAIYEGNLYLGTNQGLFYKPLNTNVEVKLIEGTQGQVWSLKVMHQTLFCGHHNGTYIVEKNRVKQVSNVQGTWSFDRIDKNTDLIIQGNYNGLYMLEKWKDSWRLKNKIDGFDNSSRYFEVLGNKIFINHEYKGIFELTVDSLFSKVIDSRINRLLKGFNSSISEFEGDVLYIFKNGIFKYDSVLSRFSKDSLLSLAYRPEDYVSGRIIPNETGDKFWLFTRNNLISISSGNLNGVPKIKKIPLTLDVRNNVVEYENIISTSKLDQYILGTSSGYMIADINNLIVKTLNVYINNIGSGINKDHSVPEILVDKEKLGVFESNQNNLMIDFYTPEYYKYFDPAYQFQLVGIYDDWSGWTSDSKVSFENLPSGEYTFNVRAKIGGMISDNIATYSFIIAKPWYITDLMLVIYVLFVLFLSIFTHHVYKRYYRGQHQKLVERNKRELELAKLQSEKEIIKIKNDQLKRDYQTKSNEVAASAISIVRKNELLMQIKDQLTQINDKRSLAPVIKIINKNLDHDENWELFKEAFDNADREFFKKIKDLHPDLSPNDLKLCAYLRLNLSSKEIAPLFNISPRSIEIKRYRLRKKMNLVNNENLTNYILDI